MLCWRFSFFLIPNDTVIYVDAVFFFFFRTEGRASTGWTTTRASAHLGIGASSARVSPSPRCSTRRPRRASTTTARTASASSPKPTPATTFANVRLATLASILQRAPISSPYTQFALHIPTLHINDENGKKKSTHLSLALSHYDL
jgi:hypothetical protein